MSSPKALSRQHSRAPSVPSVSPRFNVGLAPSPIRPLQRQSPVRDSMSPFPSFNGGPAQPPVSVYLPRRIMNPQSITQLRVPHIPDLVAQNDWLIFQRQNMGRLNEFQSRCVLPPRVAPGSRPPYDSIFEQFRNHMRIEPGNTQLDLDNGATIDMGKVDIDTALGMLRRITDSNNVTYYTVFGFVPEIKMVILPDGRIILVSPIFPPMNSEQRDKFIRRQKQQKQSGGKRRTISRKMGRNGTIKCRHRRRRCMSNTRRK